MKKYLSLILAALICIFTVSAFAANDAIYVSWSGKDSNSGAVDSPIQKPEIAMGLLQGGGTIVVSGKSYVHKSLSFPKVRGAVTFTSVYGGVDYKNAEPKNNPACAFKMASGATLTISSEIVFDDIILFQENGQNTLVVADGGVLVINENVVTMSNHNYFWNIVVEKGGEAVINGGTFSNVSGDGKITIGEKAKVLDGEYKEVEAPAGNPTVVFHSYSGKDENDGVTPTTPKKSLGNTSGAGVFGLLKTGGTVVTVGKSFLGNNYTLPTLSAPVIFTSVYDGVDYKNAEPKENPACAFKMATGTVLTIKSDLVFDDIILFQEHEQNTIKVTEGATLMVTDKVIFMSNYDYHYKLLIEKGGVAILSEEAQKVFTIEGEGEVITYGSPAEEKPVVPSDKTTIKMTIGSTTAYVNDVAQTLDAAPINRNNRTMLPVRFLANSFGVSNDGIAWDAATRTATLTNSEVTIVITIDAPSMTVNGETVALDSPAIIESNRTYLPVRAIANALGVSNDNISWDSATNTATLVK